MKFKVLATGSKGNCTIIDGRIAIDMGIPYSRLGNHAKEIKLIFLTHIHSDHFNKRTIHKLVEEHPTVKFVCLNYLVKELSQIVPIRNIFVLDIDKKYDLGICKASAFKLYHDVPNCGWKLEVNNERCIYATDTTKLNVSAIGYDLYLIESNYDMADSLDSIRRKQLNNEYAYEVRAINSHLSKEQCMEWLEKNARHNYVFMPMHQHLEK